MPLTAQVLASVVESRDDFAVRRVWWTEKRYIRERILPARWQLLLRANVYNLRENPQVKKAIDAALANLELLLMLQRAAKS
jgi:hypothetical protein